MQPQQIEVICMGKKQHIQRKCNFWCQILLSLMLLRPQAVVLCSLEPCEVSKKFPLSLRAMRGEQKVNIMWITGKKEEIEFGSGRGKRMTTEVLLYFELPFQQNRNFDWSPTCLQQKRLSPKGVQFSQPLFCGAHGEQTRSVNCTPVSKWKPRSSRNLD